MVSKMDRQSPNFKRNFGVFKEHVEAGRVDETLKLDPQSCGNERIAGNFADEITRIFLSHFDSENRNRLEALMAE